MAAVAETEWGAGEFWGTVEEGFQDCYAQEVEALRAEISYIAFELRLIQSSMRNRDLPPLAECVDDCSEDCSETTDDDYDD